MKAKVTQWSHTESRRVCLLQDFASLVNWLQDLVSFMNYFPDFSNHKARSSPIYLSITLSSTRHPIAPPSAATDLIELPLGIILSASIATTKSSSLRTSLRAN
jgi:hypothetical protein